MAEVEELEAEVTRLTAELASVKKGPDWKNLEGARDTAIAEAAQYKGLFETARNQLASSAVQIAGFKPDDKGEFNGVAGLLVKEFLGSLGETDLPDPAAFVALATKYEVLPASAGAGGEPGGNGGPDLAAQLAALNAPGDLLASLGTAPVPADIDARIKAAEDSGDIGAAIALKQQKAYGPAPSAA